MGKPHLPQNRRGTKPRWRETTSSVSRPRRRMVGDSQRRDGGGWAVVADEERGRGLRGGGGGGFGDEWDEGRRRLVVSEDGAGDGVGESGSFLTVR